MMMHRFQIRNHRRAIGISIGFGGLNWDLHNTMAGWYEFLEPCAEIAWVILDEQRATCEVPRNKCARGRLSTYKKWTQHTHTAPAEDITFTTLLQTKSLNADVRMLRIWYFCRGTHSTCRLVVVVEKNIYN
jgi:hypothetical protein